MDKQEKNFPGGQENVPRPDSADRPGPKDAKERLYDKIPITYKQADLLVKIMLVVLVAVLILGIISGNR